MALAIGALVLISTFLLTSRDFLVGEHKDLGHETPSGSQDYSQSTRAGRSAVTSSSEVYENTTLGFKLTIPGTWQGYQVSQTANTIVLSLPSTLPNSELVPVLLIYFVPASQWKSQPDGLGSPLKIYLGQNTRYAFGYEQTQDPGGVPPQVLNQIPQVVKSFATLQ
jgi:hypothetical protein